MCDTLIKKETFKKLSTPHDLDVLHIFIFFFETDLTSLIGTSCALGNTLKMSQMHVFFRNHTNWEQNINIFVALFDWAVGGRVVKGFLQRASTISCTIHE